jgi:hypothetical protein
VLGCLEIPGANDIKPFALVVYYHSMLKQSPNLQMTISTVIGIKGLHYLHQEHEGLNPATHQHQDYMTEREKVIC